MTERLISSSKRATPSASGVPVAADQTSVARARLLEVSVGLVDDLQCAQHERSPEDCCHVYQVCLPYRGLGIWHVGDQDVIADAAQVIFVRGGETYRMSGHWSDRVHIARDESGRELVQRLPFGLRGRERRHRTCRLPG